MPRLYAYERTEAVICEIINPSDSYTLETDEFVLGGVAVAFLGEGQYGLKSLEDDSLSTPVLFGWETWLEKNGIADLSTYLDANASRIADVLDSVQIGSAADREHWAELKEVLPEATYDERYAAWSDKKRSSINNIGRHAAALAKNLREVAAKKAVAT